MNDIARAHERLLAEVVADSQQPCDCTDCDGRWCVWCLDHHGLKACPVVEDVKKEAP